MRCHLASAQSFVVVVVVVVVVVEGDPGAVVRWRLEGD